MSRRTQAPKRHILPDPKYQSQLLAKFMNMIMSDGKKSVAERIIYGALDRISDRETHSGEKALELLEQALENVKPVVEVSRVVLVVRPTRCLSRCVPHAARHWPCAGSSMLRASAVRSRWRIALPMN